MKKRLTILALLIITVIFTQESSYLNELETQAKIYYNNKDYKNALKLAKPTKNINFLTPCNIGLGKILLSQNKVIEAISICNKALIKCKKLNDVIKGGNTEFYFQDLIYLNLGLEFLLE